MKKFRKFGVAMALSMFIGAGMVTFSTPVHAAIPGGDQRSGPARDDDSRRRRWRSTCGG